MHPFRKKLVELKIEENENTVPYVHGPVVTSATRGWIAIEIHTSRTIVFSITMVMTSTTKLSMFCTSGSSNRVFAPGPLLEIAHLDKS